VSDKQKPIDVLRDDTRRIIAEALPQIAEKFCAKLLGASEKDISIPHAKFLVDLAESLALFATRPAQAATEKPDPAAKSAPEARPFAQEWLGALKEMRLDPRDDGNATALP